MVSLSDGMTPDNVLVWLEGFDLPARTDQAGAFEMNLPVPAQQPNNGLTGVFKLYFYVADYWLTYRDVIVLNGYVEDSRGSIGENGVLSEDVQLIKMLTLFTDLEPDKISEIYSGIIFCRFYLQATSDSVMVITRMDEEAVTAAFIVPQPNAVSELMQYEKTPVNTSVQEIGTDEEIWIMRLELTQDDLREGDYEVVPYIVALQPLVPPGLMKHLGSKAQDFNVDFLNVPFKRQGGMLHIKPSGH